MTADEGPPADSDGRPAQSAGAVSREDYQAAFERTLEIRIENARLNWQRSAFAGALLGVLLAAAGVTLASDKDQTFQLTVLFVILVFVEVDLWALITLNNLGRQWTNWWNAHLTYLEPKAFGEDVRVWRMTTGDFEPETDGLAMVGFNPLDQEQKREPPRTDEGIGGTIDRFLRYLAYAVALVLIALLVLLVVG